MNTTKHTPGPWSASPSPTSDGLYHVYKADGNFLTLEDAEHKANARLLAAAPDLLAALEKVAHHTNTGPHSLPAFLADEIAAAIAKAMGE